MTTYSVTLSGSLAGSPFVPGGEIDIPDADAASNGVNVTAAAFGAAQQSGSQILCKFPDGSQRWCLIDAERSTFANPILVPVGP